MSCHRQMHTSSMMFIIVAATVTTACPTLFWNNCGPPVPSDLEMCDLVAAESTCADTGDGCVAVRCLDDSPSSTFCFSTYDDLPTVIARPEDVDTVLAEQDAIRSDYFCDEHVCSNDPVIVVGCRYNQYGRVQAPHHDMGRRP